MIDLDVSKGIYFPGALPGMNLQNGINITNKGDFNVRFKIEIEGSPFISVSENRFNLNPNETKEVRVSIALPEDAEGVYEGKILVYVR